MPDPLQPCPFCGGAAKLWKTTAVGGEKWIAACLGAKCTVVTHASGWTEGEAITRWNTRAQPTEGERG